MTTYIAGCQTRYQGSNRDPRCDQHGWPDARWHVEDCQCMKAEHDQLGKKKVRPEKEADAMSCPSPVVLDMTITE